MLDELESAKQRALTHQVLVDGPRMENILFQITPESTQTNKAGMEAEWYPILVQSQVLETSSELIYEHPTGCKQKPDTLQAIGHGHPVNVAAARKLCNAQSLRRSTLMLITN